jgi:opacity protein-like surface antigen
MKQLLTQVSLLFTIGIYAQEDLSKFRIGFSTGLEKNLSSKNVEFNTLTGNSAEYDKFNYRIGLVFEYQLKNSLSFNTAINYLNKDYTGTYYCIVCEFEIPPTPRQFNFRFIEVPITLKYYFLPNKVKLFTEAGLNNQFLLRRRVVADNSYLLGLKLGAGVEYNVNDNLAFQLAMDSYHTISKLYKGSDFKLTSYVIGIGVMKRL